MRFTLLRHLLFQLLTTLFGHSNQLGAVSVMRVHLLKEFKVMFTKPLNTLVSHLGFDPQ